MVIAPNQRGLDGDIAGRAISRDRDAYAKRNFIDSPLACASNPWRNLHSSGFHNCL
jgi:hypothetical protein